MLGMLKHSRQEMGMRSIKRKHMRAYMDVFPVPAPCWVAPCGVEADFHPNLFFLSPGITICSIPYLITLFPSLHRVGHQK